MPHAHHFLERLDRVTRAHTEFLLALYRDHDALKYILANVNVPEGAERIALSIDDPSKGPFAIVTRDGRFVTCLGYGMHQEHPVVQRGQIDALLARVADKRERREFARRELRPDEDDDDLLQRIFTRGRRFAREDFVAVSAFEKILGMVPFLVMIDIGAECVQLRLAIAPGSVRVVVKGTSIKVLEKLENLEWAVAHLMLLVGSADRRSLEALLSASKSAASSPSYLCSAQGGTTWLLRAAWAAGKLGKGVLAAYKSGLAAATDWYQLLDAAFGLAAIGLRHALLAAEVRRFLEGYKAQAQNPDNDLPAAGRALASMYALDALDDSPEIAKHAAEIGRQLCMLHGEHLPEGHRLRFVDPAAVPENLARTALLSHDGDTGDDAWLRFVVAALPLAVRSSAEDFYYPREVVRAWFGAWDPQEQLGRLKRIASKAAKKEPVRAAARVGRNDPCTCGSGKKWKKCHGAGAPS